MSVLGSLTQANPQSYFFALDGSTPAPAPASLTSPVVVISDGTGNTTLALNASGIAGASALSVNGSAGVPGGPGTITVGGFGTVYRATVQDASGILQIGLNSGVVPPVIQYDSQVTHQLLLGDKSAVGTASVQTNVPFVVRDYAVDPAVLNGISLSVNGVTDTTIKNAVASDGVMGIGSSVASANNIQIFDNGGVAVTVIGGNTGTGIRMRGGVGSAPPFIVGNEGDGGPGLTLGSSSGVTNSIVMTDNAGIDNGRTVINNFVPPSGADSGILLTNIPSGQTDLPQPNPLVSGLYFYAVSPGGTNDVRAGVTTMAYYSTSSSTWRTGGSAFGIPLGSGNMSLLPKNDQTVMTISNTTGGALTGASVVYCRLFTGTIGGW